MKTNLVAPLIFLALGALAHAQSQGEPSSTSPSIGFKLPSVAGTLTYALSGSESFLSGSEYGNGNVAYTTALSADLAYLSTSLSKPFSLIYSGGYLYTSIPGYPSSSTYQNLALSQVVKTKDWNFVVADAFSYLPESPTTGLSGIAGVGDIGVVPVQVVDEPAQSILTNYASRVGNGLNGGVTYRITGSTSLNGSASWLVLRFLGNQGINSTEESAIVGPSYRIDARSSFGAAVTYDHTTDQFLGSNFPFTSEGLTFQYQRQWSHALSMHIALGPQRTYGSGATLIPSQINLAADAEIIYTRELTSASLTYTRGTNNGSGVVDGAFSDDVSLYVQHQLSRNWEVALTGSYVRSSSLAPIGGIIAVTQGIFGGVQASRKINRSLSGYFSYTAITQAFNDTAAATPNIFSGLNQVFAVGLTYSPGATHPGH
jgi:hypothetical protein